ncbi:hypothetical protein D9M71_725310 [compost metagenome]
MHRQPGKEWRVDLKDAAPEKAFRGTMLHRLGEIADRADVFCSQAMVTSLHRVLRHHGIAAVGKAVVMDPGKVRHIDKAFGLAPRGSLDVDRGRQDLLVAG